MKKNPIKLDNQLSEEVSLSASVAEHDIPEKEASDAAVGCAAPDPTVPAQAAADTPKEAPSRMIGARVTGRLYEYFMRQCDIHDCSPSDAIRRLVENWGPEISFTCRDCGCRVCITLQESQPISDLYAVYCCPKCGGTNCSRASR